MKNSWNENELERVRSLIVPQWGELLAVRTYVSRLLGGEKGLVLKGGGNTSVKGVFRDVLGTTLPAVFVKASGKDLAQARPEDYVPLDLTWLRQLEGVATLGDQEMTNALGTHMLVAHGANPSIEALLHVFLPYTYIDHTHPEAILALTNRPDGEALVRKVLGEEVVVLPYVKPGFALAKAVIAAWRAMPQCQAVVLMHHGLITWGETSQQSYQSTIELVTLAEDYLQQFPVVDAVAESVVDAAWQKYHQIAPALRGALSLAVDEERFVLKPLIQGEVLAMMEQPGWRELMVSPPLTSDYLIRTKALPAVVEDGESPQQAIFRYGESYGDYLLRQQGQWPVGMVAMDSAPRVVLIPGVGVVCVGRDEQEATLVREITWQGLRVKGVIAAAGESYQGLAESDLFAMEYFSLQQAKINRAKPAMAGRIALVTGAAGAIGAGICRGLLAEGCHVAVTDVNEAALGDLVAELAGEFAGRVVGLVMDVTSRQSVESTLARVVGQWGGLDLLVLNAGIAHVSTLENMDGEIFRRLEKINVEGTLYPLSVVAGLFRQQGSGGDVVLISTKNVFAPGAGFGAYSATKAAAHQLARIASLEMAEIGVRVNMVAPDAVFSHGSRKSGLWAEVGPDRMRARGLDEKGLEEYYRKRNLLKSQVTASHVANAVLFFATRQTPTTGATIPVDGGLPDATPR